MGPYMNDDGDVWVPRTVPYLEARRIARSGVVEYDYRLRYEGKSDTFLLGFTRDCWCEDYCAGGEPDEFGDSVPVPECRVPAWHFRIIEP